MRFIFGLVAERRTVVQALSVLSFLDSGAFPMCLLVRWTNVLTSTVVISEGAWTATLKARFAISTDGWLRALVFRWAEVLHV